MWLLQRLPSSLSATRRVAEWAISDFSTATFDYRSNSAIASFVQQVDNLMFFLLFPTPMFLAYGLLFVKEDGEHRGPS